MTERPENATVADEEAVEQEPYAYAWTTGPFRMPYDAQVISWKLLNDDSTTQESHVIAFHCPSRRKQELVDQHWPSLEPGESTHNAFSATGGESYEIRVESNSPYIYSYASGWGERGVDALPGSVVKSAEFMLERSPTKDEEQDRHEEQDRRAISNFQLFAPGSECDARLPQNPIKDEFVITRFVALTKTDNGGPVINSTVPAVLPRDLVIPGSAEFLSRQAPQVTPQTLKGGAPLVPAWDDIFLETARPDAGINEVTIDDVDGVLAHPDDFVFEGTNVELDLNPVAIRSLLDYGSATVVARAKDERDENGPRRRQAGRHGPSDAERNDTDDGGDRNRDDGENGRNDTDDEGNGNGYTATLITLKAQRGGIPDGHGVDNAVRITDLYTFLSDPRVKATPEISYPAKLTSDNVRELTTAGTSEVEVEVGGERKKVIVTYVPSDTQLDSETPVAGADGTASLLAEAPGVVGRLSRVQPFPSTAPQLPTFELVLYLPYRQTWTLLGYSRGELLNSIPLAPQEETTIEIFTWDRVNRSREATQTVDQESAYEGTTNDKESLETLKETATKSSWTRSANGNFNINIKGIVQVGGGVSAQNQGQIDTSSKETHQHIREEVTKASERIKSSRQTRVSETEEFGSETRITRNIRNANMCQTLNLDCFEILASYEVKTELDLDQVRLCALTPNPWQMDVDRPFLLAFEAPLRAALLSSTYASGFDAARMLAAWDKLCIVKCAQECSCEVPAGTGAPAPAVEAARQKVLEAGQTLAAAFAELKDTGKPDDLIAAYNSLMGGLTAIRFPETGFPGAKTNFQRWLYLMLFGPTLSPTQGPAAGLDWYRRLDNFQRLTSIRNRTIQDVEALITLASTLSEEIMNAPAHYPVWAGRLYNIMTKEPGRKELDAAIDRVGAGNPVIPIDTLISQMVADVGLDDAGIYTAFQQLRDAYGQYQQAQKPPASQKKPRDEVPAWDLSQAMVDEQKLLDHIRANKSYYQYAVWEVTSPSDRETFLKAFGDLLGWVDNEVLGFVGGKAALPLRLNDHPEVNEWFEGNVLENEPLYEPPESYTVTLPTPGVTLETRLGQCDGCEEFIAQSRTLELERTAAEVKSAEERARQEELETTRYEKRLDQSPPLLDDPDPNENRGTIRIEVSKEDDSQEGG